MTTAERPAALPPLAPSGPGEWTARRDADIRAVLADRRLTVPPPGPGGPPGTVAWLRASVSRFANGAEHRGRRALVEAELGRLDPGALRAAAHELAVDQLARCGRPGDRADVMSLLARRVPAAALAARLGLADPLRAAAAVTAVAACYFPGSGTGREQRADAETAWLVTALSPAGPDVTVARIAIMVQACDATAGLIGTALHLLQEGPGGDGARGRTRRRGRTGRRMPCWLRRSGAGPRPASSAAWPVPRPRSAASTSRRATGWCATSTRRAATRRRNRTARPLPGSPSAPGCGPALALIRRSRWRRP